MGWLFAYETYIPADCGDMWRDFMCMLWASCLEPCKMPY
jgi:hypothetical protein